MKMWKNAILVGAALSATLLAGCVVTENTYVRDDRPRPYYAQPQPVVVEGQPQTVVVQGQPQPVVVQQPAEVIVREPMPAIRVERPGSPPGPGFVWVAGFWEPGPGGHWVWHAGLYQRPPHPGAVWVEPRHDVRGPNEVHFSLGFWR